MRPSLEHELSSWRDMFHMHNFHLFKRFKQLINNLKVTLHLFSKGENYGVYLSKKRSSYDLLRHDTIERPQWYSTKTEVCTSPPTPQIWPCHLQASIASIWLLLAPVLPRCSSPKPLENRIHVYVFVCFF